MFFRFSTSRHAYSSRLFPPAFAGLNLRRRQGSLALLQRHNLIGLQVFKDLFSSAWPEDFGAFNPGRIADPEMQAQVVLGNDLKQFLKDHSDYSLLIPEHQTDKFQSQVESNIRAAESPPNFDNTSDRPWAAFFTVQTIAPDKQAFKVAATWDDDWMNVGWYEASNKEIFPQYHTKYFGPSLAFSLMFTRLPIAAGITAALWLIVPRLFRRLRHRFAHSEEKLT